MALAGSMALWPAQKNLGTLLSCSAAMLVATQFWHGYGGGTYMAWYLPLVLLDHLPAESGGPRGADGPGRRVVAASTLGAAVGKSGLATGVRSSPPAPLSLIVRGDGDASRDSA